jgi:uncharacterized membrane protein YkoI
MMVLRGRSRRVVVQGLLLAAGALVAAPCGWAQARQSPLQSMSQEARVSKDAARMTALSKVPGGRMSSIELRRAAGGKLVYTALIASPGKPGKTEVVIDAMTGAMVSKRP